MVEDVLDGVKRVSCRRLGVSMRNVGRKKTKVRTGLSKQSAVQDTARIVRGRHAKTMKSRRSPHVLVVPNAIDSRQYS